MYRRIQNNSGGHPVKNQLKTQPTVLVVEDSKTIAQGVQLKLRDEGFNTECTTTGAEALAWLTENRCTLMLLDNKLPDMTGQRVIESLLERHQKIPFIVMTGHRDQELVVKMMKLGARDYLFKEQGFLDLLAAVVSQVIEQLHTEKELTLAITKRKRAEKILQEAYAQTEQLLTSFSSILIGVGPTDRTSRWNKAADNAFGIHAHDVIGKSFLDCGIKWDWITVLEHIALCRDRNESVSLHDVLYTRPNGKEGFLSIIINTIAKEGMEHSGYLLLITDVTERKILESQLSQAQKLRSIGQLAAGVAHEINTPIQYIGDNMRFLEIGLGKLENALKKYHELLTAAKQNNVTEQLIAEVESEIKKNRVEYIIKEIPQSIKESLEGVERVAKIVQAMKEYSHPGGEEKMPININKALSSTITVCRNEWKYYAEMETDLDKGLPPVSCLPGELNQVFLNIIVNAAQAIAEGKQEGSKEKGVIRVSTCRESGSAEIRISDTGPGIPDEIRSKVFDPFFTTKEVGKGTGQGLAIAHNVVVEKHGGTLTFETEEGEGTTFVIRLPIEGLT